MKRMGWLATLVCLAFAFSFSGCGSSSTESTSSDAPKAAKKAAKRSMTPGPTGKALAAADGGRVVVTMPEKWRESTSSKPKEGLLAEIKADDPFLYPRIYVRVAPVKEFNTITSDNLEEFADARRDKLLEGLKKKAKSGANVKLYGDVQPVKVKAFRGIEYWKKGRTGAAKGPSLELAYFETVVDSRMYTIELHTLEFDLEKYRPAALAVAASLKFPKAKSLPEETEESEEAEQAEG
jgi:hypothetical protein